MNSQAATAEEITAVLRRHLRVPFHADSALAEVGVDSLTVLRIAGEVLPDPDWEIDPAGLAGTRTVGDLQHWLHGLLTAAREAR